MNLKEKFLKRKEAQLAAEAEARKKADEEAAKGCGCIIA